MDTLKLTENEYDIIESAMLESDRGRLFLAEYARRNRNADTGRVLEEIRRLHTATLDIHHAGLAAAIIHDLKDMRRSISEARDEIVTIRPKETLTSPFRAADYDPTEIPAALERATHDIASAAERLRAIGQDLRAAGVDEDLCDEIDTHARGIFMASSFQDLTGKRASRLLSVLRYLEQRIDVMLTLTRSDEMAAVS